jgi:hypothetical protein
MLGILFPRVGRGFLSPASPYVTLLLVLATAGATGFAGPIVVPSTNAACETIVSENGTTTFTPCSVTVTALPNGGISLSNPDPVALTLAPAADIQAGIVVYTYGDFSAPVPAGTAFPIQYSFGHNDVPPVSSNGGGLEFGLFEGTSPLPTLFHRPGGQPFYGTTCLSIGGSTLLGTGCTPGTNSITFSEGYSVVSTAPIPYPNPDDETFGVFALLALDLSAPGGGTEYVQFLPDGGSADFADPTPEPATAGLVFLALVVLGGYVRRRRN